MERWPRKTKFPHTLEGGKLKTRGICLQAKYCSFNTVRGDRIRVDVQVQNPWLPLTTPEQGKVVMPARAEHNFWMWWTRAVHCALALGAGGLVVPCLVLAEQRSLCPKQMHQRNTRTLLCSYLSVDICVSPKCCCETGISGYRAWKCIAEPFTDGKWV